MFVYTLTYVFYYIMSYDDQEPYKKKIEGILVFISDVLLGCIETSFLVLFTGIFL
jgi:hypothetical protein